MMMTRGNRFVEKRKKSMKKISSQSLNMMKMVVILMIAVMAMLQKWVGWGEFQLQAIRITAGTSCQNHLPRCKVIRMVAVPDQEAELSECETLHGVPFLGAEPIQKEQVRIELLLGEQYRGGVALYPDHLAPRCSRL
jgi:hypothetical protein